MQSLANEELLSKMTTLPGETSQSMANEELLSTMTKLPGETPGRVEAILKNPIPDRSGMKYLHSWMRQYEARHIRIEKRIQETKSIRDKARDAGRFCAVLNAKNDIIILSGEADAALKESKIATDIHSSYCKQYIAYRELQASCP